MAALLHQEVLAVACLDDRLRYLAVSPSLARLADRAEPDLLGLTPVEANGDSAAEAQRACAEVLATGMPVLERRFSVTSEDDPAVDRHWLLDAFAVPGTDGPAGLVVLVRDITEPVRVDLARAEATDRLTHRARSDPLTGLANRSALFGELGSALAQGDPVSIVFCDLDGFKAINDGHGHIAGDRVLRAVSRRIRHAARAGDLAVRFGGDEFVVLVRSGLSEQSAVEIAQRYRAAIAQPVYVEGVRFELEVSVGVATAAPGDTADDLVRAADRRMYEDKRRGRSPPGG